MGLNAVLQYTKYLLEGIESPYLNPLQVLVQPPQLADVAAEPWGFVWAATGDEIRQSAPRSQAMGTGRQGSEINPGGYQIETWTVEIVLEAVLTPTTENIEQAFPLMYDQVKKVLNTAPNAHPIQTPTTGYWTQLLTFGEHVHSDIAWVMQTGDPTASLVRFSAVVVCEVKEKVSWTDGKPTA